jgi:hypothetical protein
MLFSNSFYGSLMLWYCRRIKNEDEIPSSQIRHRYDERPEEARTILEQFRR